jgi:hypothetical protein
MVAMCSKWQSLSFLLVSVERVVLEAIAVRYAASASQQRAGSCAAVETQLVASTLLQSCAMLLAGVGTLCCDLDAGFAPSLRRCAYALLSALLLVEAVGSHLWGNTMAVFVAVSLPDADPAFNLLSTVIYCSISVHFDLFFIITTVLGIRLKLAFLPPFYKLDLTFVSVSLHPHPAGTPDALYLVPACAASHHPVDRTLRLLL